VTAMNAINAQSWIAVGRVADIPARGARVVKAPGGDIAVFRTGADEVYALRDRCPHAAGPLSNGIVHGRSVTCPLHNMVFDLESGRALGPDACTAATVPVRVVDGVIQIQASQTDPLENVATISRSRQNVIASSGSRYAPASPGEALKWVAMSTEKYLFIGKPCDVAAVRQMQQHNPRLKENIPYIVSFMCAGTPSLQGTEQVLDKLEVEREDVTAFRYRGDGWPGLTKATLKNGDERTMTYNDSWGKVLNRHLQTRCKICPDGIGEFADIVCADGWEGDEKGYPSFEEREGNSLILVRTAKGRELFRNAEAAGVVKAEAFDTGSIFAIQPFQYYRRTTILPRLLAMKLLMLKTPSYKGFELGKGAKEIGFYQSFKAFTGLLVRRKKIKKRALETA